MVQSLVAEQLLSQLSKILGNRRTLVWGQKTSSWLSLFLYDYTASLPTSGTQTFNNHKAEVSEQATAKGSIIRTQNTSRFFQESSFLHCLSSTASPQAYTLLSGQAISFATSAAALMPIQAVIMLTEILLLNCCHTLLNNLRLIWFYQWADLTFDPHAK